MTYRNLFKAYLSFVLLKGLALSIAAELLNIDFERALILVLVSATITGAFGVVVALIQSKENSRLNDRLDRLEHTGQQIVQKSEDIKGAVGADKRKKQTEIHPNRRQCDNPPKN